MTPTVLFILYLRSPIALDKFRFPFTLVMPPISLTKPPAATILALSDACEGLWSSDRGTATFPRHSTARESPVNKNKKLRQVCQWSLFAVWVSHCGSQLTWCVQAHMQTEHK